MRIPPFFAVLLGLVGIGYTAQAQSHGLPLTPLPLDDLSAFQAVASNWQVAGSVQADRHTDHALDAESGTGVLVNRPTEEAHDNLFTTWEHGDLETVRTKKDRETLRDLIEAHVEYTDSARGREVLKVILDMVHQ